jgi:hypothetical protein
MSSTSNTPLSDLINRSINPNMTASEWELIEQEANILWLDMYEDIEGDLCMMDGSIDSIVDSVIRNLLRNPNIPPAKLKYYWWQSGVYQKTILQNLAFPLILLEDSEFAQQVQEGRRQEEEMEKQIEDLFL